LTGFIAHHYAGPGTALSFAVSGLAACCSGLCYAELAGRIPVAGSTYIYAYISLGEWAAVVAAACLTLEYGVSGAAVSRSWGDKVVEWLTVQWQWKDASYYLGGEYFNPMAGFVSAASVALLLWGVKESKNVTNFFTALKVGLVVFMTVGGFCLFQSENLTPLAPYGTSGILRGATSSFFGYLGYDEVCCIAAEAKNPRRDMPRAILWTLSIVTVLCKSCVQHCLEFDDKVEQGLSPLFEFAKKCFLFAAVS
jgi:amino acid transporter